MVTVVKYVKEHEFEGSDGRMIQGSYFYFQITKDDGSVVDRRQFIPAERLVNFVYIPRVGDKVLVYADNGKIVDMLQDK